MGIFPGAGAGRTRAYCRHGGLRWRSASIKLPDVGEGVAEAELVEWHVKPGDLVREDQILAAVMTDKATVEIPSPVDGKVLSLGAEIGVAVAVGSELIRIEVAGGADAPVEEPPASPPPTGPETIVAEAPALAPGSGTAGSQARPTPDPRHAAASRAAARRRREADRFAGRPPARPRCRDRSAPAARHRSGGPDPA
ncbi:MAG: biotin/lipoyl-containing protein [Aliidongia sp.]